MSDSFPSKCLICNKDDSIINARFDQLYRQCDSSPIKINWWECKSCGSWFSYPRPSIENIQNNWKTVSYQSKSEHNSIAREKNNLHKKILTSISEIRKNDKGYLLDIGCNYGDFLTIAKNDGWTPCGFDAYDVAVSHSVENGFDVHLAWELKETPFPSNHFSAIVANDVFCFALNPYHEVMQYMALLEPGGVLAMRITNKHLALKLVRLMVCSRNNRNAYLSKILIDQFHSVSVTTLCDLLASIGFKDVKILPNSPAATWKYSSWKTRISYLFSHFFYFLSFGRLNLYPGVIIIAKK